MSGEMTLIVVKQTRHVLGAVTGSAKADPVVGSAGILVRFAKTVTSGVTTSEMDQIEVSAEELEAVTSGMDPLVLQQPREYFVSKDGPKQPTGSITNLTLSQDSVAFTVTEVDEDAPVWVHIAGRSLPSSRAVTGMIPKEGVSFTLPIENLPQGTYVVMVLVTGRPIIVEEKTL